MQNKPTNKTICANPCASVAKKQTGLHPLINSSDNPNMATREYAKQPNHNLLTEFGVKWKKVHPLGSKEASRAK